MYILKLAMKHYDATYKTSPRDVNLTPIATRNTNPSYQNNVAVYTLLTMEVLTNSHSEEMQYNAANNEPATV